ncbi:LysR substrate-binding domain-containing protein [Pseudomonas sp. SWRI154]|uniref:LysR substrate-binding domain-containing protein n=1 Tax=Pseudomonas sp. SWRI154 TaxID=2745501 RepID=UPI0016441F98|nr:LysR substrate-binding domain-containing protein [Pseudomonas sp. SWRI154]MBC3362739.1 LysR family transcriptional regulator [Pseudomonas sp. SWRI154]
MNTHRDQFPLPEDLKVFLTVIRKNGFASAAQELGFSPAYISKRISVLEATLSTKLLHRTTRRIALTDDGERVQVWAEKLLGDFDEFVGDIAQARHQPTGSLHICSSLGFGRNHVAPAIGKLSQTYPRLDIRLDVFDRVVDIVGEGFDLEIRVGDDLPDQHLGRKLASNRRVLCASPGYLERRGEPRSLDDLKTHDCLVLKERNNAFGIWTLTKNGQEETVRVGGPLSSNSGEIVLEWALSGGGILLRSMWDVRSMLDQGRLVQVLPEYSQSANVWAVYPTRLSQSAKLQVCVEFLEDCFRDLSVPWAANAASPASS